MEDALFALHTELEDRHWWFKARRRILFPLIDEFMQNYPGELIVDVGCGTGGTVAALAGRHLSLGIDSSELAIELAQNCYPSSSFRCGAMPDVIRHVKEEAALFLLMDVLEHVDDDRGFVKDLLGCMRPGAAMLVTVPAGMALWSNHDVAAQHVRRYEKQEFEALFADLPLNFHLISYFNCRLYPLICMARAVGRLLNQTFGQNGTDFAIPPKPINGILEWIFAGERHRIMGALKNQNVVQRGPGVSLLALLQKPSDDDAWEPKVPQRLSP
jgi:SAM-dependent methyltransferase